MLTKGAIGNLVNRYRAVLKKCNLINTFGSLAVAAMLVMGGAGVAGAAEKTYEGTTFSFTSANVASQGWTAEDSVTITTTDTGYYGGFGYTTEVTVGDLTINSKSGGINLQVQSGETTTEMTINTKNFTINSEKYSAFYNGDANSGSTLTVNVDGLLDVNAKQIAVTGDKKNLIVNADVVDADLTSTTGPAILSYGNVTINANEIDIATTYPTALHAKTGASITLDAENTLNLTGNVLNESGTINLSGATSTITGDVNNAGAMKVLAGVTTIKGKMAQDGGRTTVASGATLNITDGEFKNGIAASHGGAIYNNGTLDIANADFTGNKVDNKSSGETHGGAIYSAGGNVTISDSTFTGNTSFLTKGDAVDYSQGHGGAIYTRGYDNSLEIFDSTFTGNKTGKMGGAIYVADNGSYTISGNTFDGNEANCGGAVIINQASNYAYKASEGIFENNTFKNNKSLTGDTGALHIQGSGIAENINTVTFKGTHEFTDNTAAKEGGALVVHYQGAVVNFDENGTNTFTGNSAGTRGGAIYNASTTINLANATFTDNSAADGGAIYNGYYDNSQPAGVVTVKNSTFTGNSASGKGGAIYNSGELTLEGNNVFSGNTAAEGNDIYNVGTLTINGTATFDGGVAGAGTMTVVEGSEIVLDNKNATFENTVSSSGNGGKVAVSGSGKFNDQGGTLNDLKAAFKDGTAIEAKGIAEGLISGAVDASGKQAPNTILQDTLDMATAAPLAISRIVMNDVRKRMGDLRSAKEESGVWMRWEGGKLKGDEGLTNNFNTIQVGADTMTGLKNVRAGVAAAFTHGDLDHRNGEGENETFSFSAYGTWMADNGMFADVIARVGFSNTETTVKGTRIDLDNEVLSLSGEYGWRLPVCNQFFVEPQVELTYTYVTSADSKVQYATYDIDSVDSLIGRAGLVAGWNLPDDMGNVYARASVVREFLGDGKITGTAFGNSVDYKSDGEDTWLEYGIGANVKLTDKTYIWADVERTAGADLDEEWRGTVGVRFSF